MSNAQPAPRQWTYAHLADLPPDQLRHELIDGEHVVTPSPNTLHQEVSRALFRVLDAYVERHRLGEVLYAPFDVKLSLFTVLVPDLVYFTAERFRHVVNDRHATAAPDLVVEILSPGTRRRDKGRKRVIYDREGVREYWIVDPESRSVTVLRRPDAVAGLTDVSLATLAAGAVLTSPLFPGLRLPLRDVFRSR
ncbi:MAG: Uma2 family endonuclease [Rhodospirillaceae bacterium]